VLGASRIMEKPLIYKNIKCNAEQLARLMTLIDDHLENQEEMIDIYKDKLNGAYSTDDVNFCQETIKDKKDMIQAMLDIKKQMEETEFTTKHTL
tara:strand:- start:254 stop:535 length:282 start_codon:yes stop_codon:yes gene_type:complete